MFEEKKNPNIVLPGPEVLSERRKPKFIMDVNTITSKEYFRVKKWGHDLVLLNEHKFNDKWKHLEIVSSGTVKAEDIDIRQIYPFKDLHWIIYRHKTKTTNLWILLLMSKNKVLSCQKFCTI